MYEETSSNMYTTSIDDVDFLESERYDSGINLSYTSVPSCCTSDLEAVMKNLSIGQHPIEEDEFGISQTLAFVPTDVLFYQNHDGDTLLHLALICKNMEYVTYLSKRASRPGQLNILNHTFLQTPLHIAVATGNLVASKLLLEYGASTLLKNKDGNTPLHVACSLGRFDLVVELMATRNYAKIKAEGNKLKDTSNRGTELDGSHGRRLDVLQDVMMERVDDDHIDSFLSSREYDLLKCHTNESYPKHESGFRTNDLLRPNPNCFEDTNFQGRTCLHLALDSHSEDRFKIIEHLVCQHGINVSMREGLRGYTILHELVRDGDLEGVTFLINLRIPPSFPQLDVNTPSYDLLTPLDVALRLSYSDIAEELLCSRAATGGTSLCSSSSSESSSD